jgi:hypothetical protein
LGEGERESEVGVEVEVEIEVGMWFVSRGIASHADRGLLIETETKIGSDRVRLRSDSKGRFTGRSKIRSMRERKCRNVRSTKSRRIQTISNPLKFTTLIDLQSLDNDPHNKDENKEGLTPI